MIEYVDPQFAYALLCVPFVVVWITLFLVSRDTRREQLRTSAVFAIIGVVVENLLYFNDYWKPESMLGFHIGSFAIYPEFLLFGGAFSGIAAVIYQVAFRKQARVIEMSGEAERRSIVVGSFVVVLVVLSLLPLNSIYASAGAAMVVFGTMSAIRRDLFIPGLVGGTLTVCIMFVSYSLLIRSVGNVEQLLREIWFLYGTDLGTRFVGIPLTELVWGFAIGSAVSIVYKFINGIELVS